MSEKEKQIEKERKDVVELLLKKNGLTRKQLVDDLVGMWAASWAHILTDEEKKTVPSSGFLSHDAQDKHLQPKPYLRGHQRPCWRLQR